MLGPNGIYTSVMNLYRNMDRQKIQWDFVLYKDNSKDEETKKFREKYIKEIESLGGRIFYLNYEKTSIPRHSRKLLRNILSDPDIMGVHMHDVGRNTYPLYLAKEMDKPVRVIQFHSGRGKSDTQDAIDSATRSDRAKVRLIAGDGYDRFACSDISGEVAFLGQPFEVFPNAVDTYKFSYNQVYRDIIRSQLNIPHDAVVFGFVAVLYYVKNPKFAIRVFEQYRKSYNKNAYMIIVGDGEMRVELQEYIKNKHLKKHIIMLGIQKQSEIFYSAFDMLLCPSLWEGLPNNMVEAQCNGCQCLASDEISEMVRIGSDNTFFAPIHATAIGRAHLWR